LADGSIDVTKAVTVNEQFQVSRQFWAYAAENRVLTDVRSFLNPVPHVSFARGDRQVDFLRRHREALAGNPLFAATEFIDDADEFARRLPLMAAGRDFREPVALNWAPDGTDVDFGSLSKQLIGYAACNGTATLFGQEVRDLTQEPDGTWTLKIRNNRIGEKRKINAKFVFGWRRRLRVAAAAAVRDRAGKRFRWLPDWRQVPAIVESRAGRRAPRQGLRLPGARRAENVGPAS
jgi:malate dehydrogenase (quinone)